MILAYLDPGSGSLLLQVILGGAGGLAVAVKAFGSRFRKAVPVEGEPADDNG